MTAQGSACPCNPCQRAFAARYVMNAVTKKKLIRAKDLYCVDCGKQARDYDHYLDYRPENVLAVHPVCRPCHQKRTLARRSSSCRLGHPYAIAKDGSRYCRQCRAVTAKRIYARHPKPSQRKSRVVTIEEGLRRLQRKADKVAERAIAQAAS